MTDRDTTRIGAKVKLREPVETLGGTLPQGTEFDVSDCWREDGVWLVNLTRGGRGQELCRLEAKRVEKAGG